MVSKEVLKPSGMKIVSGMQGLKEVTYLKVNRPDKRREGVQRNTKYKDPA